MQKLIGAILAVLAASSGASAQFHVESQRTYGDWTVIARRGVWDDVRDPMAASRPAAIIGMRGHATLELGCNDRDGVALYLVWPDRVAERPGQRTVFTVRVGSAPVTRTWAVSEQPVVGEPTAHLVGDDFWPAARQSLEASPQLAFGAGMPPAPTAAIVSLAGFKEAAAELERLCKGR